MHADHVHCLAVELTFEKVHHLLDEEQIERGSPEFYRAEVRLRCGLVVAVVFVADAHEEQVKGPIHNQQPCPVNTVLPGRRRHLHVGREDTR